MSNKKKIDIDREFSDFMHSQVPEVEPESDLTLIERAQIYQNDIDEAYRKIRAHIKDLPDLKEIPWSPITDNAYDGNKIPRIHLQPDINKTNEEYEKYIKNMVAYGQGIIQVKSIEPTNLFGEPFTVEPEYNHRAVLIGQDILDIKQLTGKREKAAKEALQAATVEMLANASPDCFYIKGSVPSSKNGKNPVTVRNINKKTGKPQEFTTLVPNDLVKKYIKETKGEWLQNKVSFLNQTRHMPLPLEIEFTFIRASFHRFDFINACQILSDLMTENGWIQDDDSIHIVPVFNKVVYFHSELAGVLIKVLNR